MAESVMDASDEWWKVTKVASPVDIQLVVSSSKDELVSFYESLLLSTAKVTTVELPVSLLDLHKVSRIMVMMANDVVLGWVSNFGDAASRACEITFAGGGHQTRREYVHWVQATVGGPETIAKLLQCNIRLEDDNRVAIPKCLAQYLIHTPQNEEEDDDYFFVPVEELKAAKTTPALASSKPRTLFRTQMMGPSYHRGRNCQP